MLTFDAYKKVLFQKGHLYLACCQCEKKGHIWTSLVEELNFLVQLLCVALAFQVSFTGRDGLPCLARGEQFSIFRYL